MRFQRLSRNTDIVILAVATLMQFTYALLIYQRWGQTFVAADDVTHSYIARELWFGMSNMGGTWLPLYHILLAPFTLVPALYVSGLAGVIVNAVATGLSSLLLYRIVPNKYGVLASLVFAGNYLTLTYSATASTEPTAILFAFWALYYLKQYLSSERRESFFKMALVLSVGELTRYEVWVLALALVSVFAWKEFRRGRKYNLAFTHLAFWGAILWMTWDTAIFRSPIFFLQSPGALGIQGAVATPNFQTISAILARTDIQFELVAATIGASLLLVRNRPRLTIALMLTLIVGMSFQAPLYSTFYGNVNGYSQTQYQQGLWTPVGQLAHSDILVSTRVGYVGGDYLTVLTGVDPSKVIDEFSPSFAAASSRPWEYADYVVILNCGQQCDPYFQHALQTRERYWGAYFNYLFWFNAGWHKEFALRFTPVYTTNFFILYQRENPMLNSPRYVNVNAGSTTRFIVNATNTDTNDTITLTATGVPQGASFATEKSLTGNVSSAFSWTPSEAQAPHDYHVTFTATDGRGIVTTSSLTIHVSTTARAALEPNLSPFGIPYQIFTIIAAIGVAMTLILDAMWRKLSQSRRLVKAMDLQIGFPSSR
jgi:hypothetical protein